MIRRCIQVGVGIKEAACRSKCRDWLSSCEDYYFGYTHISGKLMPCREDDDRNMICTKLSDLVADETEFCEAMGKNALRINPTGCAADGGNVKE